MAERPSIYETASSEAAKKYLRAAEEKAFEGYAKDAKAMFGPPKRRVRKAKKKVKHGSNPPFGSPAWRAKYGR